MPPASSIILRPPELRPFLNRTKTDIVNSRAGFPARSTLLFSCLERSKITQTVIPRSPDNRVHTHLPIIIPSRRIIETTTPESPKSQETNANIQSKSAQKVHKSAH